jgi:ketosteroid isomerase-like protein
VATLAPDAVLMPGGHRPLETPAQISEFWWPRDGSQTRVTTFARQIEELSGGHDFAFVRGRDSVAFTYRKGTISASQVSRTMTLSVVRRGRDGRWRISRMMWATRSD